ncbi:Oligoendopeptidase F, M3B family [Alteracholeplasma palmae J233]|uniref:Oligoendopeptidase F, M3B family n=1 Tax=Alteracholeplasma palmae (strain ATCC 49389 / J233) TaxID=1318466 RepID=U4KSB7_ALTPJ|nr:M3 family oligoendopeptidase [Alteracholeplasma palmae]CCV64896.1 Oligoendopeptidase F, M3B family [Alteracholeplasma palmae J233]
MTFNEFPYQRPSIEEYKKEAKTILESISNGKDAATEIKAIKAFHALNDKVETMITLASIRNSIDTRDEYYEAEQAFFDENMPYLQEISNEFTNKILTSKNREALVKEFGELLFKQAEVSKKTFKPEIVEDLQLENKLSTEYSKLTSSAQIEFEGSIYNLSQMAPFVQSTDRETRKQANLAVSKFFSDNLEAYDRIYDDMVQVRTRIAKRLGYENFVQLGYDRFGRTDYTSKEVKAYREQIYETVVPLVNELTERKAKRLGIKNPQSYDLTLSFLSGNPTPKGNKDWQVEKATKMYKEMSKETDEFFTFMLKNGLLELDSKPGKQGGGYCTFLPSYNAPFIFANFNGTSHDVDVLTHEAGHAFQVYQSRNLIPEYRWPTMEAAEIHSMSMEFLAWPWINEFFLEDTEKYKFSHLAGAVTFLPYGALVDHFQHEVYENPSLTPTERRQVWRKLEKQYLPFKKYDEDEFLENGGFWLRQGHIFSSPFYYIDYTLAQVCAFQYWTKSREDYKKAWESYLSLCKLGGSKSFLGLVEASKLKNPFIKGSIKEIIKPIKEYLDQVDDKKL